MNENNCKPVNDLEFTSPSGVQFEVPFVELVAMFKEAGSVISEPFFEKAMLKKEFRDKLSELSYQRILGGLRVFAEENSVLFRGPLTLVKPSNPGKRHNHSKPIKVSKNGSVLPSWAQH